MLEEGGFSPRLRRVRRVVYLFCGLFALLGHVLLYLAVINGDGVEALIGATLVVGSIGLALAARGSLAWAADVDKKLRGLANLRKRADAVETLLEELELLNRLPQPGLDGQAADAALANESAAESLGDLRDAYRESVYSGDFAAALATGRRIVAQYPGSATAAQVNELGGILQRRVSSKQPRSFASDNAQTQ